MNTKIIILFFLSFISLQAQEVLTQQKAIELALENNFGVKMANNNVEIEKNNTDILNSDYLPTITANGGAVANLNNIDAEFSNGTSTSLTNAKSSNYNASINLNYTIFDGFGREYNYKRLKEQYNLSELEAKETIENTLIELFSVYYSVAQLKENVKSLTETLDISKKRLSRTEYQFEYGQNTKLGVLNAEVDINNDSINIINAIQQLKNAKRNLNVIIGNTLKEDFDINTDVDFSMYANKEEMLESAKQNNTTLLKTEKNIAISELNMKITKAGFLPVIGVNGSYGWSKNNNNAASFLSVATNTGLTAGLTVSWNLFDGGSNITAAKNAKINIENQKLQQQNNILNIERDFNNAWDDYHNKYQIYLIQERNINTSKNNFDRTLEKFQIGQATSIEFRQAQLNLLNAELSRNQAKYETKFAELQLLQLSGELLNLKF
ncbi:transporter [Wenyingzhuangia fucanilytica]|uniref:Transporter n=1 Tax=Wenyingzhuangia fucanilytica TaxID=1790137 RepID=A0A1B1Y4P7_9FLAO|nr:TolC family protein [Wenyingzhuangia fucanilytica]ANW95719.1 transporter [Wenyingzhuangia fucanilytica]